MEALGADHDPWVITRVESRQRPATGPEGQSGTLIDSILAIRRLPRD